MKANYWIMLLLGVALVTVSVRLAMASNDNNIDKQPENTSGMDAIECIMTRTSVRQYSDKAVPDSIIERILRAGMAAPTAVNRQPWFFVLIKNRAALDRLAAGFPYSKMLTEAAFAVAVCADMNRTLDSDTREIGNWALDCSAASENMLLAAHALGLGGVWCGIYPQKERAAKLTEILDLPANLEPFSILSFGYPAAATTPKQKWDPAKIITID